ncbi:MAG: heavy metal translocating P-type ATPase [Agarilytica sp.]
MTACFHCGLPAVDEYSAPIDGETESFCCIACQTVATAISSGGLVDFYRYRDKKNIKAEENPTNFNAYDLAAVQEEFVYPLDEDQSEVQLSISGISCAACAWLIEKRLAMLECVTSVSVNASNYRCRLVWDKSAAPLSDIFSVLSEIGFQASPYSESNLSAQRKKESRRAIMRLGVAGIGMMQVGMFAIALHAGAIQGMDDQWRSFFRYVSLIVATPVVLYSAQSFFSNAWRSIKNNSLTMDVPVALAIGLAYIASAFVTLGAGGASGGVSGDVYFDSISMFTFFLLLGRFVEMKVRHSSAFASERMSQLLPVTVDVVRENDVEAQPINAVQAGQSIRVVAGAVIPCDGTVLDGRSSVNESLLTGESEALVKKVHDKVFAGSTNGESPLVIRVESIGKNTRLAAIERMIDKATTEKPKIISMADRFASKFVMFVLLSASLVAVYWYNQVPERALWIVLSVLVATCPCALSLATPAAVTAGINTLRRFGLLVSSAHFIEKMPTIDTVVFDKTGTLTKGALTIKDVIVLGSDSREAIMPEGGLETENRENREWNRKKDAVLAVVAGMEFGSKHPIAGAFQNIVPKSGVHKVQVVSGKGVCAVLEGDTYRFGSAGFACEGKQIEYPGEGLWCLLSKNNLAIAWILFEDVPREHISHVMGYFESKNVACEVLSGDREENVAAFCKVFNLPYKSAQSPEDKFDHIQNLQKSGKKVLMLGDGINDVPVLSAADISIAVGDATRLAQIHADAVLTTGDLERLIEVRELSLCIKAKIKQNLSWAFLYNFSVLPAAAMGYVPPWAAAIGMSISSLLVVLNALTIQFFKLKLKAEK